MAKIPDSDYPLNRLKALEKELARKEEEQRKKINNLIGYARGVINDKPVGMPVATPTNVGQSHG